MEIPLCLAKIDERLFSPFGYVLEHVCLQDLLEGIGQWTRRSRRHIWTRVDDEEKTLLADCPDAVKKSLSCLQSLSISFAVSFQGLIWVEKVDGSSSRQFYGTRKLTSGSEEFRSFVGTFEDATREDRMEDFNSVLRDNIDRNENCRSQIKFIKLTSIKFHVPPLREEPTVRFA